MDPRMLGFDPRAIGNNPRMECRRSRMSGGSRMGNVHPEMAADQHMMDCMPDLLGQTRSSGAHTQAPAPRLPAGADNSRHAGGEHTKSQLPPRGPANHDPFAPNAVRTTSNIQSPHTTPGGRAPSQMTGRSQRPLAAHADRAPFRTSRMPQDAAIPQSSHHTSRAPSRTRAHTTGSRIQELSDDYDETGHMPGPPPQPAMHTRMPQMTPPHSRPPSGYSDRPASRCSRSSVIQGSSPRTHRLDSHDFRTPIAQRSPTLGAGTHRLGPGGFRYQAVQGPPTFDAGTHRMPGRTRYQFVRPARRRSSSPYDMSSLANNMGDLHVTLRTSPGIYNYHALHIAMSDSARLEYVTATHIEGHYGSPSVYAMRRTSRRGSSTHSDDVFRR